MSANLSKAQELLFGKEGLGATNFKLFPGSQRELSPDEVSAQIVKSIGDVVAGNFEHVDMEAD